MSIIGNALAHGLGQGVRTYAQLSAAESLQNRQAQARREELSMRLKADRDELIMRLEAQAKEGAANRENALKVADAKNVSQFERRPDLYGAEPVIDRSKFESNMPMRVDDSEYSDAVSRKQAPLIDRMVVDEAGLKKADTERIQRNIDRKTQVDSPQHYDDQQRGRGRERVNALIDSDPTSPATAAASLAVEGKDRHKVAGNVVLDNATGETRATEVGESVINKNNRAPAPRAAAGGGGDAGKNARQVEASLARQLSQAKKELAKLEESPSLYRSQIESKRAEIAEIDRQHKAAIKALGGSPSQGDNGGARPGSKDFSKLWRRPSQ